MSVARTESQGAKIVELIHSFNLFPWSGVGVGHAIGDSEYHLLTACSGQVRM